MPLPSFLCSTRRAGHDQIDHLDHLDHLDQMGHLDNLDHDSDRLDPKLPL